MLLNNSLNQTRHDLWLYDTLGLVTSIAALLRLGSQVSSRWLGRSFESKKVLVCHALTGPLSREFHASFEKPCTVFIVLRSCLMWAIFWSVLTNIFTVLSSKYRTTLISRHPPKQRFSTQQEMCSWPDLRESFRRIGP